ncbi:hypothetical protein VP01_694g10 [Puccinia sorghi]|uniref:Uncharacterized protein n=1 Tax=Puccinia sorghi TaxID=27349 RepID=A0A0L6UG72_9BASI|nr:hypothetical protein VP01_694g10 [Puccinia sorghi]
MDMETSSHSKLSSWFRLCHQNTQLAHGGICLRRTKDVLMNLSSKTEQAVVNFGKFFWKLTRIWQFCNHPLFARDKIEMNLEWEWRHSANLVHLIDKLKLLFSQGTH